MAGTIVLKGKSDFFFEPLKNDPKFDVISEIFTTNNLTEKIFLSTRKEDLKDMFNKINNDETMEKIWKLRNKLRKEDFDKREAKDFKIVDDNDWEDLACFFYKTIRPTGEKQCEIWFNHLEDEVITKSILIAQDDEDKLNVLIAPLELKVGQKYSLSAKIEESKKKRKGSTSITVTHKDNRIGTEINGGEIVHVHGPITVGTEK